MLDLSNRIANKSIAIISNGEYEDIVPYVVLSLALKRKGYSIFILSDFQHKLFIEDSGLHCVPICGNDVEKQLLADKDISEVLARRNNQEITSLTKIKCREIAETHCSSVMSALGKIRPDLIIEGTLMGYFGIYAKHLMNIPCARVVCKKLEVKNIHWIDYDLESHPLELTVGQIDRGMTSLGYLPLKFLTKESPVQSPLVFNGVLDNDGLEKATSAVEGLLEKQRITSQHKLRRSIVIILLFLFFSMHLLHETGLSNPNITTAYRNMRRSSTIDTRNVV